MFEESKSPRGAKAGAALNPSDPLLAVFREKLATNVPVPIAGVQTLLDAMSKTRAVTIMGIQNELKESSDKLKEYEKAIIGAGRASISFKAGVELFFRYVTRNNDESPDFSALKQLFIARGHRFVANALKSRAKIAELGHNFVQDGMVVLTHGRSEVVTGVLRRAAQTKNFTVMVTEGRPEGSGFKAAERLLEAGIPVTVILDSAVGYFMERVDVVLFGAEGVVESGGIVNKIGTCQMAMVAKTYNKPVYVAAEAYKFARLYPLNQADLETNIEDDSDRPLVPPCWPQPPPPSSGSNDEGQQPQQPQQQEQEQQQQQQQQRHHRPRSLSCSVFASPPLGPEALTTQNPCCDYTPANYISLLFTDLGILTPAAVSDELIRLYQ